MKLNFHTHYPIIQYPCRRYNNSGQFCTDKISFGAMKKSHFNGIDLLVINQFKTPIEKFNKNEDFQNWCEKHIHEIKRKDYAGRQWKTSVQRKEILNEWFNYVLNENSAYTNSIALFILSGITGNLKPNDDNIPPPLNKGILAKTIDEIQTSSQVNKNSRQSFLKPYLLNLQKSMLNIPDDNTTGGITGWIVIPSAKNDSENFSDNVEKLKNLSNNNWCTKSFNAHPYLYNGDFHIYLENGCPKIGIRYKNDEIQEIQGEKNNLKIPPKYFSVVKKHIENENLSYMAKKEIDEAVRTEEKIKNFMTQGLKKDVKDCSQEDIFNACGIKFEKDENGMLVLSEYHQPDEDFTFEDIGINENKLFKNVKAINGDANFFNSEISNLKTLEYIGGNARFCSSKISDLGNLKKIEGSTVFTKSKITSLSNLDTIGGNVTFAGSEITSLDNLKYIGGNADFAYSKVSDLGNLLFIGGDANFKKNKKIKILGNLERIEGDAIFEDSEVALLGNLNYIGRDAVFSNSKEMVFRNLKTIGRDAIFIHSDICDLGSIENIGRDLILRDSKLQNADNLKNVKGCVIFAEKSTDNVLIEKFLNRGLKVKFAKPFLF